MSLKVDDIILICLILIYLILMYLILINLILINLIHELHILVVISDLRSIGQLFLFSPVDYDVPGTKAP